MNSGSGTDLGDYADGLIGKFECHRKLRKARLLGAKWGRNFVFRDTFLADFLPMKLRFSFVKHLARLSAIRFFPEGQETRLSKAPDA